jgi:hypothetical protein
MALRIIALHPGVSLDWIYRGVEDYLSIDIMRRIEMLPDIEH